MTIVGTALLEEPDIRQAQKTTLETLLQQISPVGQVPSNVRIDTGLADYSGVGGICSVDSGLWFIIGFYNYIRVSGDLKFLKRSARSLRAAMNWLAAHDSNNDGLLEIPEAGDWTDLFARSYNVLYDEVLWYRCQFCYGRLLEWLGEERAAADYFQNGHRVRAQIMDRFWPDSARTNQPFASLQFSLGDVSYLLAEITPFGFSWRCDVFGNVLAFLFHVVDVEKARRTFQFLWGVGVNEPHPVACLYPSVNAGDPDWKPYHHQPAQFARALSQRWNLAHGRGVLGALPASVRATPVGLPRALSAGLAESTGNQNGLGIQRVGPRPHRKADGKTLSGLVGGQLHPRLSGTRHDGRSGRTGLSSVQKP